MTVSYPITSPWANTPQTTWYLGYYTHRSIPPSNDDILYTVDTKYHHRPHLLSYDYYGSTDFWWIFAVRNPDLIKDPIYDLERGMNIYIPSFERLQVVLS
ncbi:MAG: hypothetical protein WC284_18435 [Candidimonas sp.]